MTKSNLFSVLMAPVFMCAMAVSAVAKDVPYICEMTSHTRFGSVPPQLIIVLDREKGTAHVYDGFIATVHGAPIPANVTAESDYKYRLNWELTGVPASGNGSTNTSTTARFDLRNKRVTMTVYVGGFANNDRGEGKCEILKK